MSEHWKPIRGYEGLYSISDHGRVKSCDRITTRIHLGKLVEQPIKERILKTPPDANGYPVASLCKEGVAVRHYIHILVAEHFISGRTHSQTQVCHRDGNTLNPHYLNLRYDTPVGNAADRHKHGTDARGTNNPGAKLNEEQVRKIKVLLKNKTIREVSDITGVNYSTVRCINNGSTWGWLGI